MGFWVLVALVIAVLALRRVYSLEQSLRTLRGDILTLQARLSALSGARAIPTPSGHEPAAAGTVPPAAQPPPVPDEGTAGPPAGEPDAAAGADGAPFSTPATWPEIAPGPPADLPPPAAASADAAREDQADSLERRIGSRWLLYLGVGALVLGVSYFVKYAFDNEWIAPPLRVLLGLLGGAALIEAGRRFVARDLARYGQTLTGGGVGILYLTVHAAHHWYGLIGRPVAFGAMVLVTVAGVWLADRQRSQVLALFAVSIGFLTPLLIGGESRSAVVLFTYDLIFVGGTLALARRRDWPALNIVSFMLTTLTISTWAERNYQRSDYAITELFLTAFLVLFLGVLRENRKSAKPIAPLGSLLLGTSPILYHLASLAVLGPHRGPLLVYFIGVSVAGVIAAQHLRLAWLRLLVWLVVALPFLGSASAPLGRGWLAATWIALGAIYGVHLIAQAQALDDERGHVPVPEVLLLHANGLWALAVMWLLLAPRTIASLAPAAFAFAAFYAALALGARRWHRDAALHGAALAAVMAAAGAAMRFSGPWVSVALAADGTALVWLGLREGRPWLRHVGSLLLSIAVALLLLLLARPLGLGSWPFLNPRAAASAFVVLLLYAAARFSRRMAVPEGSLAFAVARLVITANVLTVLALSAEISGYFGWSAWEGTATRGAGAWTSAELARQLTLSIVWAAYAVGLIAAGLARDYRPIRLLAIVLFAITIGKVFFVDLAELDRVFRMLSVMGLGLLLLTASYLYQRFRAGPPATSGDASPSE